MISTWYGNLQNNRTKTKTNATSWPLHTSTHRTPYVVRAQRKDNNKWMGSFLMLHRRHWTVLELREAFLHPGHGGANANKWKLQTYTHTQTDTHKPVHHVSWYNGTKKSTKQGKSLYERINSSLVALLFGGQCEALARCQEGKNVVNPIETLNLPFLVPIAFMLLLLLLFPCHPKAFRVKKSKATRSFRGTQQYNTRRSSSSSSSRRTGALQFFARDAFTVDWTNHGYEQNEGVLCFPAGN